MKTMSIGSMARWSRRQLVAGTLAVAMLGVGVPSSVWAGKGAGPAELAQAQSSPRQFYLVGDEVLSTQSGGDATLEEILSGGSGTFSLSYKKARFEGARATIPFDWTISRSDVKLLGNDPETEVRQTIGRDLNRIDAWVDVAELSVHGDELTVASSRRVGRDRMTATIPRHLIEQTGDSGWVVLEVNDRSETIWVDSLEELSDTGGSILGETILETLAPAFTDPKGFAEGMGVVVAVASRAFGDSVQTQATQCFTPCARCARDVLAWGISYLAIASACIAVPISGGLTLFLCGGAIAGHFLVEFGVMMSCGQCMRCKKNPEPEPGEDSNGCTPCEWGSSSECQGVPPPWCNA